MRDWIYPSVVFVIFLYAMAFILFYTYKGQSSYGGAKVKGGTTSIENFQSELNKKIK
ncbi:hypothetical protein [Helicobacter didelphidarum]|uniref:hypothetical protein n=1 Tax=Helicobacter didelphidarum TaxID=2040648 RepID=UPI0015F147C5|nr:hypothetical protein [Helicobacter didelphidarum]